MSTLDRGSAPRPTGTESREERTAGGILVPGTAVLEEVATPHRDRTTEAGVVLTGTDKIMAAPVKKGVGAHESGLLVPEAPDRSLQTGVNQDEVAKYGGKKETRARPVSREQLFYVADPWGFFNERLERAGVVSPIPEIQRKLKAREKVNTATLEYNHWGVMETKEGQVPEGYYRFLEEATEFAGESCGGQQEMDRFFGYLNSLNETQIYANRCYKLDNPRCLESITRMIHEHDIAVSDQMCDFFSYFELPDTIKRDVLARIPATSRHPLRRYLLESLKPENPNAQIENVGIEIEGFPTISMGPKVHPRFTMGIDGGHTMPELRRDTEAIPYDKQFKQDLFELWYWAKMSRLAGASIHIHIDDTEGEGVVNTFKNVFGNDMDDVKSNSPGDKRTIETRFNLPCYEYFADGSKGVIPPSEPAIYNLYGLIDELIKLKDGADRTIFTPDGRVVVDGYEMGEGLHPFWGKRFKDRRLTMEKAIEMMDKSKNNLDVIRSVIWKLPEGELVTKADDLMDRSGNDPGVIWRVTGRLPEGEVATKADGLINRSGNNLGVIQGVTERLPADQLAIKADDLIKRSENDPGVIWRVIEGLPEGEVVTRMDDLIKRSENDPGVIWSVIGRLPEGELVTRMDDLMDRSENNPGVIRRVIERLPEGELATRADDLIKKSENDLGVIWRVIERLPEGELVTMADDLIKRSKNDLDVIQSVIERLPESELVTRMDDLIKRSGNDPDVIRSVIESLPDGEARELLMQKFKIQESPAKKVRRFDRQWGRNFN